MKIQKGKAKGLIRLTRSGAILRSLQVGHLGYLKSVEKLSMLDFHERLILSRRLRKKRPSDTSGAEFDSAISRLFQSLTNVSREFLYRSASCAGVIDESDYEFVQSICESLVSLGSTNLQCIATDDGILALYLQQCIAVNWCI
ncbi:unnamed protein product [Microthlaspi erraticum]|uniref:Exportin-5 C-terminal domain-containing protein n=1 Tax=Microthlaspi erraticum TaxID=1685480 RepID=A0A6D2J9D0_9BRAS|nr:unnamed protein product [Microthlaspi erraticum]